MAGETVSRASFPYPYKGEPPTCGICNQPMKVYRPEESLGCAFECDPYDCRDNLKAKLDEITKDRVVATPTPKVEQVASRKYVHEAVYQLRDAIDKALQDLRLEVTAHHRATANDLLRVSTQLSSHERLTHEVGRLQEQQRSLAEQVTRELADFRKQAGGINIAVGKAAPKVQGVLCEFCDDVAELAICRECR